MTDGETVGAACWSGFAASSGAALLLSSLLIGDFLS